MRTQFLANMAQIRKAHSYFLDPVCQHFHLTQNEMNILLYLAEGSDMDRASDIVQHHGMTKGHVSLSVSHLEELGLIRKRVDPDNRRTVHLMVTEAAAPIIEAGYRALEEFETQLYRGIPQEDIDSSRKLFNQMARNVCNPGQ